MRGVGTLRSHVFRIHASDQRVGGLQQFCPVCAVRKRSCRTLQRVRLQMMLVCAVLPKRVGSLNTRVPCVLSSQSARVGGRCLDTLGGLGFVLTLQVWGRARPLRAYVLPVCPSWKE